MSGIDLKIKKLFNGKKNLVISAIDHVLEYGDQPGIEDSRKAIEKCLDTDALLLSRYSLLRNWDLFANKNAPMPVVRINWSSAFYYPLEYRKGYTGIAANVEDAVNAGAEIIICSLFLENNDEEMETKNVALFSEVVRQKEKLGIPLIGECYVVEHKEITPDNLHLKVKRVSRIMAELGADLVKAFYTNNFSEVIKNTPVPVFSIGAEKLSSELDVLKKAYDTATAGARGIIFGRNIFMSENPYTLVKALNAVINDGLRTEEAFEKYIKQAL
ncbi:MAG: class I fructose-bisphosphate aldolase [Candidatus Humimicrobiaceae bacterium]